MISPIGNKKTIAAIPEAVISSFVHLFVCIKVYAPVNNFFSHVWTELPLLKPSRSPLLGIETLQNSVVLLLISIALILSGVLPLVPRPGPLQCGIFA